MMEIVTPVDCGLEARIPTFSISSFVWWFQKIKWHPLPAQLASTFISDIRLSPADSWESDADCSVFPESQASPASQIGEMFKAYGDDRGYHPDVEAIPDKNWIDKYMESQRAGRDERLHMLQKSIVTMVDEAEGVLQSTESKNLSSALEDAFAFLTLLPRDAEIPSANPTLDGEIRFEWGAKNKRAVVILDGEAEFGYAYYQSGRFIPGGERGAIRDGIPNDLVEYILELS